MAVYVVDHPLVRHKLGILRMGATSTREFRSVSNEIARLLIYEATKGFRTEKHTVEGWKGTKSRISQLLCIRAKGAESYIY